MDIISSIFLFYLIGLGIRIVGSDILRCRCRKYAIRQCGIAAVHACPISVLVKLNFSTVRKPHLIILLPVILVPLCVSDLLSREILCNDSFS